MTGEQSSSTVLIVEDSESLASTLKKGLEEKGYTVQVANDGLSGYEAASGSRFDLILLDRRLPGLTGDEVCSRLREQRITTPVLMLTAAAAIGERIRGLDLGADDYMTKPFAFAELIARLRALSRRADPPEPHLLRVADLEMDPSGHLVRRAGKLIALSAREFALLEYLLRNPGRVLSQESMLGQVWGDDGTIRSNVVEVYINYLRRKIDSGHSPKLIHTVRGVGYVLRTGE